MLANEKDKASVLANDELWQYARTRQNNSAGGDDNVVADFRALLDDGALTDQHAVADGGGGDQSAVTDGHLEKMDTGNTSNQRHQLYWCRK